MAARLEGLEASLQSGDAAEDQLRSQMQELAERVAVLTAAQVCWTCFRMCTRCEGDDLHVGLTLY